MIGELASTLRQQADQLDAMVSRLTMPVQQVDIPGSFARLRAVIGKEIHVRIKSPDFDSYSFDDSIKAGPWSVYLGTEAKSAHGWHEGQTLADAVNAAIKAWRDAVNPPETDAAEAMQEITQALAEPLPM